MPESVKKSGARWQLGIALLIGVFLVGMAASLVTAARRVSRVVDTDYYSHGLHYGETHGAQNPGMSWTIAAALAGGDIQVRVNDASGAPVAGGTLSFEPEARGGGRPAGSLQLTQSAPGLFLARRPPPGRGELHGTLLFTRGDAVASRKLVLLD
jgi:hypothetical protein